MPDRSYFPEGYQHFITIPYGNDVNEILRNTWEAATCQNAVDAANIDYKSGRTPNGQVFAFTSATDKAIIEAQIAKTPEFEGNLQHVEKFHKSASPLYIQAWQEVVREHMYDKGHKCNVTDVTTDNQVVVIFANEDSQQAFENADRDNVFIEFAINRQQKLERDEALNRIPVGDTFIQKVSV